MKKASEILYLVALILNCVMFAPIIVQIIVGASRLTMNPPDPTWMIFSLHCLAANIVTVIGAALVRQGKITNKTALVMGIIGMLGYGTAAPLVVGAILAMVVEGREKNQNQTPEE
ncbi:MAG: hypothetical protein IJU64_00085 [Bacilli bacterium]|nr:hypothetical protein [Bacilli bacterium]